MLNENEKEIALNHVLYEMSMYFSIPKMYIDPVRNESDEIKNNSYLECRLLHLRNLIEFFSKESTRDDDMLANSFFPEFKQNKDITYENQEHKPEYKALNKSVMHLTEARFKQSDELSEYFNKGIVNHDKIDNKFSVLILTCIRDFLKKILNEEKYCQSHEKAESILSALKQEKSRSYLTNVTTTTEVSAETLSSLISQGQ